MLARIPSNKSIQIIAIGTVGAESLFVEESLNTAPQTHLVRVLLIANWPAHFAMTAAAKHQHRSASYSGCKQTEGKFPAEPLFICHQNYPGANGLTRNPGYSSLSPFQDHQKTAPTVH